MDHLRRLTFCLALTLAATLSWNAEAKPFLLSAAKCGDKSDYTQLVDRYEKGVIFKVKKCKGKPSYLVGTMHSDDPVIDGIYQDSLAVLGTVKAVGFEFVEDDQTSTIAQQYMLYPMTSSEGLSQQLTEDEFNTLARFLEKRAQIPVETVNRFRPWAAAILMQFPEQKNDGITFDARLQSEAAKLHKELFSLETVQEQYNIFARLEPEKQMIMLRDALSSIDELENMNDEFLTTYSHRDLKKLAELADESFNMTSDKELREYMRSKLLTERNSTMTNRMQEQLNSGNVLIAVGALHLMGETGILTQLEEQGYMIEVVR